MSHIENHGMGKWGKCDFCGAPFTSESGQSWVELMAYNFCFGEESKGVHYACNLAGEIEEASMPLHGGDLAEMPALLSLHWECFPGYRAIAEMEKEQATKDDEQ